MHCKGKKTSFGGKKSSFKRFDNGGLTTTEKNEKDQNVQNDKKPASTSATGSPRILEPDALNKSLVGLGTRAGIATAGLVGYGLYKGVKAGVDAIRKSREPFRQAIQDRKAQRRMDRLELRGKKAREKSDKLMFGTDIDRKGLRKLRKENRQARRKKFLFDKSDQLKTASTEPKKAAAGILAMAAPLLKKAAVSAVANVAAKKLMPEKQAANGFLTYIKTFPTGSRKIKKARTDFQKPNVKNTNLKPMKQTVKKLTKPKVTARF